jgi:transcriptional regulator with XRE-family HTH domain
MPNWNIPVKPISADDPSRQANRYSPAIYSGIPGGYASAVSLPPLARNISSLRRAAKLNQGELGDRLGVGQPAVSKWERGETEPDASVLPLLARELGARLDALLHGVDPQYDASDLPRHSADQRSGSHQEVRPDGLPTSEQRARLQIAKLKGTISTLEDRLREVRDGARDLARLASGRGKGGTSPRRSA